MSWEVSFGVHDGEAHKSLVTINLDGATTIADIDDWVPLMQPLIQNLVQGDTREVRISRIIDVFTAGAAQAASDVEIKAKFFFQPLGTIKKLILSIPTFDRGKILANTDIVDQSDEDVAAFIDAMVNGIEVDSENVIRPRDTEDRTLDGLIKATEDYGKKRK